MIPRAWALSIAYKAAWSSASKAFATLQYMAKHPMTLKSKSLKTPDLPVGPRLPLVAQSVYILTQEQRGAHQET